MGAGVAGAGFSALGSLASGIGQYQNGKSAAKAAKYNAKQAKTQARIYRLLGDRQAQIIEQRGAEEERRQRVVGYKALGAIRAGYGASGIDTSGSALDVLEESARNAELDALTVRYNARTEALNAHLNAEGQAIGLDASANLDKFQARNLSQGAYSSLILGGVGAAATLGGGLYDYFNTPSDSTSLRRAE